MKLRYGYIIMGIVTGFMMFLQWIPALPDGKLHVMFCDVKQGDAMIVRFPDGRLMMVDTGPGATGLACLGKYLPFFQKTIDILVISHPQEDHAAGLPAILSRYRVTHIIHAGARPRGDLGKEIAAILGTKQVTEHMMYAGDSIVVGGVAVRSLSPAAPLDNQYISWKQHSLAHTDADTSAVLGATSSDMNMDSIVLHLAYGDFDVILTGDADAKSQSSLEPIHVADGRVELLKVPHHGAKNGMSESFLTSLCPRCTSTSSIRPAAIISVGKNTYGHPSDEVISRIQKHGYDVFRTDRQGDITVSSDGVGWEIHTSK